MTACIPLLKCINMFVHIGEILCRLIAWILLQSCSQVCLLQDRPPQHIIWHFAILLSSYAHKGHGPQKSFCGPLEVHGPPVGNHCFRVSWDLTDCGNLQWASVFSDSVLEKTNKQLGFWFLRKILKTRAGESLSIFTQAFCDIGVCFFVLRERRWVQAGPNIIIRAYFHNNRLRFSYTEKSK